MGTIITIASGKGGVGKTLVTAALGLVLSRRGKRILLVDGDMGLRDLDLVLGVQDDVLYDVTDVIRGRCSAGRAILSIGPGLDFLAASQKHTWEKIESSSFQYVLEQLAQEYDGVLVDSPPGRGRAGAVSGSRRAAGRPSPEAGRAAGDWFRARGSRAARPRSRRRRARPPPAPRR